MQYTTYSGIQFILTHFHLLYSTKYQKQMEVSAIFLDKNKTLTP